MLDFSSLRRRTASDGLARTCRRDLRYCQSRPRRRGLARASRSSDRRSRAHEEPRPRATDHPAHDAWRCASRSSKFRVVPP